MKRRDFPKRVKLAAWERCAGHCEECAAKIIGGRPEYDHDIPDAIGGEPTLENCIVRCRTCHARKTAELDAPRIAKVRRQREKHLGIRNASRFPGGRWSRWKKKVTGEVVLRDV